MAVLSGSANCMKYVLFTLNFIFVLTGIIIISVGVAVEGTYKGYKHFLDEQFFSVPTLLIVIGSFIFFIAFLGCCGAYKENYCMILSFSILLVLIFILELAAGISGYVLKGDTQSLLRNSLNHTMKEYGDVKYADITASWDAVQIKFQCCGIDTPDDWKNITIVNQTAAGLLPLSCCDREVGAVGIQNCTSESKTLHKTGCLQAFGYFISEHAISLGAVGITLAVFQVVGIGFACYIARQIKVNNYG